MQLTGTMCVHPGTFDRLATLLMPQRFPVTFELGQTGQAGFRNTGMAFWPDVWGDFLGVFGITSSSYDSILHIQFLRSYAQSRITRMASMGSLGDHC